MFVIDTLVVVATNRGASRVRRFIEMQSVPYPILVVDTGTPTDDEALGQLRIDVNVAERWPNVLGVVQTPYRGYDTGAYLWAYWKIPARNYLFLQDSVFPRRPDYVTPFQQRLLPGYGAVAWSGFAMMWDSVSQAEAIKFMYGYDVPERGIFGPIFYTSKAALDSLSERGLLPMPPNSKLMAQGCERAWAIGFHRAGLKVAYMHDEHDRRGMEEGQFQVFTKEFGGRK